VSRTKTEQVKLHLLVSILESEWEDVNYELKKIDKPEIKWEDFIRKDEEKQTISSTYKGEDFTFEYVNDKESDSLASCARYREMYVSFTFPAFWEICHECRGDGRGLIEGLRGVDVTEMCQEDPDFYYAYAGGRYDTHCHKCAGSGKRLITSVQDSLEYKLYSAIKHLEWEINQPCPIQEAEMRGEMGYQFYS